MSRGLSAPHGVASSQKREIFGFAPYWLLGHNSEWNYNLLSTVAYFGLDVQSDGTFAQSGNGFNGWNSADMTNLINNAHRAGTNVVVTIKDFNDASINIVDATSARQVLINNVIAAIQATNLDRSTPPASKILVGVPSYGYRWSTASGAQFAATVGTKTIAEGYSAAMDDLACPHPAVARGWDAWGESPWANWWSPGTNAPCADNFGYPQEMYYDDATSLGLKYDLINSSNLRGVGIWSLGMDSGRSELWSALSTYFSCPVSVTAPAAPTTTEFSLSLTAGPCSVAYYDVHPL